MRNASRGVVTVNITSLNNQSRVCDPYGVAGEGSISRIEFSRSVCESFDIRL